eukprot:scaffold210454_cov45-Attheya_sp.AAC.1
MKVLFFICGVQATISAFQNSVIPTFERPSVNSICIVTGALSAGNSDECVNLNTNERIQQQQHECKFCSQIFSSRNALFRHISICSSCSNDDNLPVRQVRHALVFKIGYFARTNDHGSLNRPEAETAGLKLEFAVKKTLSEYIINVTQKSSKDGGSSTDGILSSVLDSFRMAQSSVAMQRHDILSQETGCAAAGDIVTISFLGSASWFQNDGKGYNLSGGSGGYDLLAFLAQKTNHYLEEETGNDDYSKTMEIRVVDVEYLAKGQFHAEKSATQRIYHYLLPLKWLKDGEELQKWWLLENEHSVAIENENHILQNRTKEDIDSFVSFKTVPPSNSLKRFRNTLKNAESVSIPNRRVRRSMFLQNQSESHDPSSIGSTFSREIKKVQARKLGTLVNRERRAWHNFADPSLKGKASPNHEPIWRVLDRARIHHLMKVPHKNEAVAVLEFRGDAFIPQQVRRLVGTALAVNRGWLPENVFDLATSADTVMNTVLAPAGRLYLNRIRFHTDEGGIDMLKCNTQLDLTRNSPSAWLRNQLLSNKDVRDNIMEEAWLKEVESDSAPHIILQMNKATGYSFTSDNFVDDALDLPAPPKQYLQVLGLLREIVKTRTWPDTSTARSKIILKHGDDQGGEVVQEKFGSFTIANPNVLKNGVFDLPIGNRHFPDLVEAVFELELMIASQIVKRANIDGSTELQEIDRGSSSHCAVNFNAQFTPHVDSGRGLGQSLSMIIGLGDYNGGEIIVEGAPYPIRYQPLEFDGWRLRHWTNQYEGERFSLVFFTPDM